jgi:hypothetical protein
MRDSLVSCTHGWCLNAHRLQRPRPFMVGICVSSAAARMTRDWLWFADFTFRQPLLSQVGGSAVPHARAQRVHRKPVCVLAGLVWGCSAPCLRCSTTEERMHLCVPAGDASVRCPCSADAHATDAAVLFVAFDGMPVPLLTLLSPFASASQPVVC